MSNMRDIKTSDDLELLEKIGVEEAVQLKEEYENVKGGYEKEKKEKNSIDNEIDRNKAQIEEMEERIKQAKEGKVTRTVKKGINLLQKKIKDIKKIIKEKGIDAKVYLKKMAEKEKKMNEIRGKVKKLIREHDEEVRFAKRYEKYKSRLQEYGDPEMVKQLEGQMIAIREKNKNGQQQGQPKLYLGAMNTLLSEQVATIRGRRVIRGVRNTAVRTGQTIREGAYRTAGAAIAVAKFVDTPRRKANEFLKNLRVQIDENYVKSNEYNGFGDRTIESDESDRGVDDGAK